MFVNVGWIFQDDPAVCDCQDVARDVGKSFWETVMGVPVDTGCSRVSVDEAEIPGIEGSLGLVVFFVAVPRSLVAISLTACVIEGCERTSVAKSRIFNFRLISRSRSSGSLLGVGERGGC